MGMLKVSSVGPGGPDRSRRGLAKAEGMRKAIRHKEPDRVPISDFFWGSFVSRWQTELGLTPDVTPYAYYDLDWVATVPNMDPWMRPFETLQETGAGNAAPGARPASGTAPLPPSRGPC
jgi:hypothetical protein